VTRGRVSRVETRAYTKNALERASRALLLAAGRATCENERKTAFCVPPAFSACQGEIGRRGATVGLYRTRGICARPRSCPAAGPAEVARGLTSTGRFDARGNGIRRTAEGAGAGPKLPGGGDGDNQRWPGEDCGSDRWGDRAGCIDRSLLSSSGLPATKGILPPR
jgi:hypothetical protein